MRLIDADKLKETISKYEFDTPDPKRKWGGEVVLNKYIPQIIDDAPTIEAINAATEMKWIPVSEKLPFDEAPCLVTCQEWEIAKGQFGHEFAQVLSYLPKIGEWNTKAFVRVTAWMPLPELYRKDDENA